MISVTNLTMEYKMGQTVIKALDNVAVSIESGEFVCVLGPSGSGKSTLLNMIGGLDRPVSGAINVDGSDVSKLNETQLANFRKNKVGFIFQSYNLLPNLTALENVSLPLIFAKVPKQKRDEIASGILKEVGLGDRLSHRPTELSGGEQQRVSIARALVNKPAVILADEPTGNLDTKTSENIMTLLKDTNIKNKQTFVIVTHNEELKHYTDKVVYMKDGKIEREEKIA